MTPAPAQLALALAETLRGPLADLGPLAEPAAPIAHLAAPLADLALPLALPLAHLGHYLWVFYLIPVLIVVGGIIYTSRAEKRRDKEEKRR